MKRVPWIPLLLLAILVAGCGEAAVETQGIPKLPSGEIFQIAFPRIVVNVDAEGNPSIPGISPALIGLIVKDTSTLRVPKATVEQMMAAGVQHIEVASVGDRIVLVANGKLLPHLGWNAQSLAKLMDVLDVFEVQNAGLIRTLAGPITRLGLDVAMRFPKTAGAVDIPLAEPSTVYELALTPNTEPASVVTRFEVHFDEQGQPSVFGVPMKELTPYGVPDMGSLTPETISLLRAGNIQHAELRTKPEGAYIFVNGEALPQLIWDSTLLANAVDLASKLAPGTALMPVIQELAPYMDQADIDILLHFPLAPGAEPIPAQMHD